MYESSCSVVYVSISVNALCVAALNTVYVYN